MTERLASVCSRRLLQIAQNDPRIWLLDGDLADSYGATEFARELPSRFVMAGIAEQNMVAMAAGLAACEAKPWVFSFAAFLAYRATDQIRVSVAQTGLQVVLVGSHAGGCGGRNGKSHQSIGDLATLGSLPGMTIWTPCDPNDVAHVMEGALTQRRPTYIRTPRDPCAALPGTPGALRWLTAPASHVIVCAGLAAHWALEVRNQLGDKGLEVGVLHVGRFAPPPSELRDELSVAQYWFVVEDHVRHGGLGDLAARLMGRQPDGWFGWPSDWSGGSGASQALRASCQLDSEQIARTIASKLRGHG